MARTSIQTAVKMTSESLIDDTSSLKNSPVFIFSGTKDEDYPMSYQIAQKDYYDYFGANVMYELKEVKHEFPSIYSPNEFLNPSKFDYDLVGNFLKHLLTNLETGAIAEDEWKVGDTEWASKGVMRKFYQHEFLDSSVFEFSGLAEYGYVYYPD